MFRSLYTRLFGRDPLSDLIQAFEGSSAPSHTTPIGNTEPSHQYKGERLLTLYDLDVQPTPDKYAYFKEREIAYRGRSQLTHSSEQMLRTAIPNKGTQARIKEMVEQPQHPCDNGILKSLEVHQNSVCQLQISTMLAAKDYDDPNMWNYREQTICVNAFGHEITHEEYMQHVSDPAQDNTLIAQG